MSATTAMSDTSLVARARTDPEAMAALVDDSRGFIGYALQRFLARHGGRHTFARVGLEDNDLEQFAWEGFCRAVRDFEPERGLAFSTYAFVKVDGELTRRCRDTFAGGVRVPREEHLAGHGPAILWLDAPVRSEREDGGRLLGDFLPAEEDGIARADARLDDDRLVRALLSSRSGRIACLYVLRHLTQAEIGRLLGITQKPVSQHLRRGLAEAAALLRVSMTRPARTCHHRTRPTGSRRKAATA